MRDRALKSRAGRSWSWRRVLRQNGSRRWPAPPRCSRCSPRSATRAGCGSWLGVAEIAGGIGLLVPRLTTWAAAALGGLMVGAAASELRVGHTFEALIPLQWLVFFVAVVWLRSAVDPGPPGVTLSARPVAWDWGEPHRLSRSSTRSTAGTGAGTDAGPPAQERAQRSPPLPGHSSGLEQICWAPGVTSLIKGWSAGAGCACRRSGDSRSASSHRDRKAAGGRTLVRREADRRCWAFSPTNRQPNCRLSWPWWCGCRAPTCLTPSATDCRSW